MFRKLISIALALTLCVGTSSIGYGAPADLLQQAAAEEDVRIDYINIDDTDRIAIYDVLFTEEGTLVLDGRSVTTTLYHVKPRKPRPSLYREVSTPDGWQSTGYWYGIYSFSGAQAFPRERKE